MARPVYAVFVAGGSGSRMGGDVPKQFLELRGVPVLERSVERFLDAVPDAKVVIVLPDKHVDTWREICLRRGLSFPQTIVRGGMTRFHSVQNALEKVPDGAIVSIHDAVRPLASEALIAGMVEKMREAEATGSLAAGSGTVAAAGKGQAAMAAGLAERIKTSGVPAGLIPVIPVIDTLRSVKPGVPAPDRSTLVGVQTPQMFFSEALKEAYRQPYDVAFTDDASVAERAGFNVATVPGERFNIKITTPEDLILADALLGL